MFACTIFNEQDKGSNLLSIITWSVLRKQNVQAKKVCWTLYSENIRTYDIDEYAVITFSSFRKYILYWGSQFNMVRFKLWRSVHNLVLLIQPVTNYLNLSMNRPHWSSFISLWHKNGLISFYWEDIWKPELVKAQMVLGTIFELKLSCELLLANCLSILILEHCTATF